MKSRLNLGGQSASNVSVAISPSPSFLFLLFRTDTHLNFPDLLLFSHDWKGKEGTEKERKGGTKKTESYLSFNFLVPPPPPPAQAN